MLGKRILCLLVIVGLVAFACLTFFGSDIYRAIELITRNIGYIGGDLGLKGPFSIEPAERLWEAFWDAYSQMKQQNSSLDYITAFAIDKGTIIGLKTGSLVSLGFCMLLTAVFPKMRSKLCFVGALFVVSLVNLGVALNANTHIWEAVFNSLSSNQQDMLGKQYYWEAVFNPDMLGKQYYTTSFFCAIRDSQAFGWLWVANLTAIVNCMFGRTLSKIKGVGKGIYLLPFVCATLAMMTYFADSWLFALTMYHSDGLYFLLIFGFYGIFCTQILKVSEIPEKTMAFNLVWHILLLCFSAGLWKHFWAFRTTRYLNKEKELKKRNLFLETLLYIFVSPYRIWWAFRTGALVEELGKENGVKANIKILCLITAFFTPIAPAIILQVVLNKIVKARGEDVEETPVVEEFSEDTTVEEIAQEALNELTEDFTEETGIEVALTEEPSTQA